MYPHTTHHACAEQLKKYGGKTIGCCCIGHNCKQDPATRYEEEELTYQSLAKWFFISFMVFNITLGLIMIIYYFIQNL